jgi:hypothetical protein
MNEDGKLAACVEEINSGIKAAQHQFEVSSVSFYFVAQ